MYKYKIKEQGDETLKKFQDERIVAFDSLEARLEDIKKLLRQGKIEKAKSIKPANGVVGKIKEALKKKIKTK